MRVFVTGASGWVGSAVTQELVKAGHQVLGLARSEANVKTITANGGKAHPGSLEDLDSLRKGVAESDGVIHCGFIHDFSKMKENCRIDHEAIDTMGEALKGSKRPFIVTSGTALVKPGTLATEDMISPAPKPEWPRASEARAEHWAGKGLNAMIVRLAPSVHGEGDHGFLAILIGLAREKGVSAYVGEGKNRWTGVHRFDAANLYRLALEKGTPGARFHASESDGVTFKEIATALGQGLNLPVASKSPEEAGAHFGWFAGFAGTDIPASSKLTRERLGWKPTHPTLLQDLAGTSYFKKG